MIKMSNVFDLPVKYSTEHVDSRLTGVADSIADDYQKELFAMEVAVNNHDELVLAISESNNILTNFTEHGFVRDLIKRNFELLDKIKAT